VVQITPGQEDRLRWCWSGDGVYSAKSAYGAFFAGRARYTVASQIWRSRAPYGCKFFAWIVSRDQCWTADRLEHRRLPRPAACPLCDQEPETIQHLLLGCVVARQVCIWRHRNDVVFNGARPEVEAILARIREDYSRWRLAKLFRTDSFGLVEPVSLQGESNF
jgi:hypothetical protein